MLIPAVVVAAILQLTLFLLRGVLFPAGAGSWDPWTAVSIISAFSLIQLTSRCMTHKPDSSFKR